MEKELVNIIISGSPCQQLPRSGKSDTPHEVVYTTYAPDTDITFIMRDTFEQGCVKRSEVVGWYHGEPDEGAAAEYIGKMVAEY